MRAVGSQLIGWALLGLLFLGGAEGKAKAIKVSSTVKYEFIGEWNKERLNKILEHDFPQFTGITVNYGEAKNGVKLYRVEYRSIIPELKNKTIRATGLVAVPDFVDSTSKTEFPLLSYQHGTVYGKEEVPSMPENSPETQLMLALFAGQGYVVIGADYFGMGESNEPEGYMVKGSHQQAAYDMLLASESVLKHLKVSTNQLFLSGWSQGGFVTMSFLETLEEKKVKVAGTATASAPLDLLAMLTGFFSFPRDIDASWINSVIILSSFSFEHYYNSPGLARSVFNDQYYDLAKNAYLRKKTDLKALPTDLRKLVRPEYFDPHYLATSPYGRLMGKTEAYRWAYASPVRNYYGETDEAIPVGIGRLAMTYAQAMGKGNPNVTAYSTGKTSHRGTYATAAPEWKRWFDSLVQR